VRIRSRLLLHVEAWRHCLGVEVLWVDVAWCSWRRWSVGVPEGLNARESTQAVV
jgi:hypothetical protein